MTESTRTTTTGDVKEMSTGDLVAQLSGQVSGLVRQEMRLAQAELRHKARHAGIGAGLAGAGTVLAFLGLAALVTAAIAALALALPLWASALIVGAAVLLVAGVLGMLGRRRAKRGAPPIPEQAVASVRRDAQTVKERSRHA